MSPRDEWRSLMMGLPEQFLFDIIRNYTGEFETPYNKQNLIGRLESFLLKPEVRQRIEASLSRQDAELLAAAKLFREPELPVLLKFYKDGGRERELHHHIMNLQYRLLLFSDTSGPSPRLRINPLLRKLIDRKSGPQLLFPSLPAEGPAAERPWLNDLTAVGLLSYFEKNPDALKSDGTFKKRSRDEMQRIFVPLWTDTPWGKRIDLAVKSLTSLKLLRSEGAKLVSDWYAAELFGTLPDRQRSFLLWTHLLSGSELSKNWKASLLQGLIDSLDPQRLYSRSILSKILAAVSITNGIDRTGHENIIDAAAVAGLITEVNGRYQRASKLLRPAGTSAAPVLFHANMQVSVDYETPFYQAMLIGRSADIEQYDTLSRYELSKKSFSRLIHAGMSAEEYLKAFSGGRHPVPRPVQTLLKEWEKTSEQLTFYDGVVLRAEHQIRHLIEHDPRVSRYIKAAPAAGIYIFDRDEHPKWIKALTEAGIEQAQSLWNSLNDSEEEKDETERILQALLFRETGPIPAGEREESSRDSFQPIERELTGKLESLDLLPDAEKELRARIQKRLVLFPEQVRPDMPTQPGLQEARGLDFMGKVKLIEQTLQSGHDLLEVIIRTGSGKPDRLLLSPLGLDKSGKELVLRGVSLPEEEPVELEVRKFSLVRRLNGLLFYPGTDT